MPHKSTDWDPKDGENKETSAWTHDGAHEVTTGEVDGDVSFSDELKEKVKNRD